ncbi:MAG: LicD family protein [Oscillospiraceae bacterium]|nr:LicD family protein [Oscillospiraceae bacterium]
MTNDYGNLELHQVLLAAMKDIDKICRENGLKYYLHAGTLLGAFNHGGFIPWDDDVDISMFPEDFRVLEEVIAECYSDRYKIKTYDNTMEHYSKLNKLQVLGADVVYTDGNREAVFVDISVFHGVPNSKLLQKKQCVELTFWDRVISIKAGRIIPTSWASKLLLVPLSRIGKKKIGQIVDRIMRRYDHKKTEWVALMIHMLPNPYTGMNGYYNDFVPRSICDYPKNIAFEDASFMVYSEPERDLIRRYGENYWKPYPEEKRVSKHSVRSYVISESVRKRICEESGM